jgi:glycosyltransferase involved in cell wall biosynthesis
LRVLQCVLSLDVGGLERIVLDLARVGKRNGADVSILCLERLGKLEAEARAHGIAVTCLHKPPGINDETVTKAADFLTHTRPDIVHTHQIGALWYVGRAAGCVGVSAVLHTEHIDNVAKAKGWWRKLKCRGLWNRAARHADRFCCVSADIARSAGRWLTVPRRKIEVVLNGIDAELFADRLAAASLKDELGIPVDVKVIGNVARLNEEKRHDLLLKGFARLRAKTANVHLLIVGDGPERQRLADLANELGIANSTTFAGYQSRRERYLQIMDVFALTSRMEGLPLALLEAWAARVPVVCTAVGGVPDVVKHGENGLLIPSGDEGALVAALSSLLDNPQQAASYARSGQALVQERYSLARMAADYQKHYTELLSAKRTEQCASAP